MSEQKSKPGWLGLKEASKIGLVIGLLFILGGVVQLLKETEQSLGFWPVEGYPFLLVGAAFLCRCFRPNFTFLKQVFLLIFGPIGAIGLGGLIDAGIRLTKGGNIEAVKGESTAGLLFVFIAVFPVWYAFREGDSGRLFRQED